MSFVSGCMQTFGGQFHKAFIIRLSPLGNRLHKLSSCAARGLTVIPPFYCRWSIFTHVCAYESVCVCVVCVCVCVCARDPCAWPGVKLPARAFQLRHNGQRERAVVKHFDNGPKYSCSLASRLPTFSHSQTQAHTQHTQAHAHICK